jgi:hypothetical protein
MILSPTTLALAAVALGGCAGTPPPEHRKGASMSNATQDRLPIVRVSIGRFEPGQLDRVRKLIADSDAVLTPGIRQLAGNIAYYAGIDPVTHTVVNVSVWDSLEHARQMETFQPMREQAAAVAAAGVQLERPIHNFETLWMLPR